MLGCKILITVFNPVDNTLVNISLDVKIAHPITVHDQIRITLRLACEDGCVKNKDVYLLKCEKMRCYKK